MRKWGWIIIVTLSCNTFFGAEVTPSQNQGEGQKTPEWANKPPPKLTSSPEALRSKRIALVVLGTAATVTIGLVASGRNLGKHAPPSSS